MAGTRIALVTGATQGLGLALVEGLAARMAGGDHVFLTGRDPARVEAEVGVVAGRLTGAGAEVHGRVVDVTSTASVQAAADAIAAEYGGIDIVFSNAGSRMSPDRAPAEEVDQVAETYNHGALRMLRSFGPLLRPGGRFFVVASALGTLGQLDPRVRAPFERARSLDDIERIVESWRRAVHDGSATELGWPGWLNLPSKVAQVAAVRVAAAQRRERDLADGTLIAAVCPGLIDTAASRPWFTDMSRAQTPEEAARALLDLGLAPSVDPKYYGELVQFGAVLPWEGVATTPEVVSTT
ncbi:SDR family NAD(P)-dependent oxidoreductase [Rugosimonospora africana]|nr:SDR family NAD(P)-dependent oxidoreductase [Rugosimonospora africana]